MVAEKCEAMLSVHFHGKVEHDSECNIKQLCDRVLSSFE